MAIRVTRLAAVVLAAVAASWAAAQGGAEGARQAAGPELFVPACAHVRGLAGTSWRTDLTVHNVGATAATYTIHLLPRDAQPPEATVTFTLGPGATQRFTDILDQVFGYTGAAALRIVPVEGTVVASARTSNAMAVAGLGQQIQALPASAAISSDRQARIIGLAHEPELARGYRSNLGLLNVGPEPIVVEAEFLTQTGRSLGAFSVELPAFGYWQRDRVFEQVTAEAVEDGLVVVRSGSPGARFLAWGSVVDNATGDAAFVPAVTVE